MEGRFDIRSHHAGRRLLFIFQVRNGSKQGAIVNADIVPRLTETFAGTDQKLAKGQGALAHWVPRRRLTLVNVPWRVRSVLAGH
jgi:hypothetical protein